MTRDDLKDRERNIDLYSLVSKFQQRNKNTKRGQRGFKEKGDKCCHSSGNPDTQDVSRRLLLVGTEKQADPANADMDGEKDLSRWQQLRWSPKAASTPTQASVPLLTREVC